MMFLEEFCSALKDRRVAYAAKIPALLRDEGNLLLITLTAVLLITDLSGVLRAEVSRIWIFLMVFVQMAAAFFCAKKTDGTTIYIVAAAAVLQTAVSVSMVGFVAPFELH